MPASGGALHRLAGAAQPSTHEPPVQMLFDAQALPHVPQFAESFIVFVHVAKPASPREQSDSFAGHVPVQLPATHA